MNAPADAPICLRISHVFLFRESARLWKMIQRDQLLDQLRSMPAGWAMFCQTEQPVTSSLRSRNICHAPVDTFPTAQTPNVRNMPPGSDSRPPQHHLCHSALINEPNMSLLAGRRSCGIKIHSALRDKRKIKINKKKQKLNT